MRTTLTGNLVDVDVHPTEVGPILMSGQILRLKCEVPHQLFVLWPHKHLDKEV